MTAITWLVTAVLLTAPAGPLALPGQADPAATVAEADKLLRGGRLDQALALYRQALETDPDLYGALRGAGIVLDLQGRHRDARRHLEKAIEHAPEDRRLQALAAMAVSYAFERRAEDAGIYFEKVFDHQASAGDLEGAAASANALGRIHLEAGDLDEAARWYQTGYETALRQPALSDEDRALWEFRWAHAQARIAARAGRTEEARQQLALARTKLARAGANVEETGMVSDTHYLAGYVALYSGDLDQAIAELSQANPRDPFVALLLARAYEKKGDEPSARTHYARVLESTAHTLNTAFSRRAARAKLGR